MDAAKTGNLSRAHSRVAVSINRKRSNPHPVCGRPQPTAADEGVQVFVLRTKMFEMKRCKVLFIPGDLCGGSMIFPKLKHQFTHKVKTIGDEVSQKY